MHPRLRHPQPGRNLSRIHETIAHPAGPLPFQIVTEDLSWLEPTRLDLLADDAGIQLRERLRAEIERRRTGVPSKAASAPVLTGQRGQAADQVSRGGPDPGYGL